MKKVKTPMNDVLTILHEPKQLTSKGLKELIDHISFDTQNKISSRDKKTIDIINSSFSAGVDEGVKECIFRLTQYPGFQEFLHKNLKVEEK